MSEKKYLAKIIAKDPNGLQVISATLTFAPAVHAEIICKPSLSVAII